MRVWPGVLGRFTIIGLTLVVIVNLTQRLYQSSTEHSIASRLILTERLGLASMFCPSLPTALTDTLQRLALFLETNPQKKSLLRGEALAIPASANLTSGFLKLQLYLTDPTDEIKSELETQAHRGLKRLNICFAAFCSLCLLSLGLVLYEAPKKLPIIELVRSWWAVFGVFSMWYIITSLGLERLAPLLTSLVDPTISVLINQFLTLLVTLLLLPKAARGRFSFMFGRFHWSWIGWGWLACLGTVSIVDSGFVLLGIEPPVSAGFIARLMSATPWQVAQLLLLALVISPVIEELMFRGWLLTTIRPHLGPTGAVLTSALLFAAVHGNALSLPGAFALGICLGWVYLRSGSLWASILVHSMWNLTTLIHIYAALPAA